jgi:hypothetical protein
MPYSNPCDSTKTEYQGDGSTTLFSFSFEYAEQSDVKVYLWNDTLYELNTDWTWANATTIQFNSAPPAPNPAGVNNIRIVRETSIDPLSATFYPGASIKAKDLNDNFEQLQFAIEENRCIADQEIDADKIPDGLITTDMLADGAVTTPKLADSAVTTVKLANDAVTTAKLVDNAVTTPKIIDLAVTEQKINTGAVTENKLADCSVTTPKICDGAVTEAKLDPTIIETLDAQVTAAQTAATTAQAAANSALAAYDNFDDTYLGDKASDPTTDNDGDPLNAGDLYFNTTDEVMKLYTGTQWVAAYVSGDAINIGYDNSTSNLAATNVQSAIDELDSTVDSLDSVVDDALSGVVNANPVFWKRSGTIVYPINDGDGAYAETFSSFPTTATDYALNVFDGTTVNGHTKLAVSNTGVVKIGDAIENGTVGITLNPNGNATFDGNITVTGDVDGRDVSVDGAKLDGIEAGATADQTSAEIKASYESNNDTNAFTDAEKTKLAGIETGATGDQTAAEIKTAYESNADTNAYTDAEKTKLAGIETNATADQTASEIKTLYESNNDTNAFTDAEQTKLAGIAAGAEVNVDTDLSYTASTRVLSSSTGADVTLPEVVASGDSGLMTGADKAKLDGIDISADDDQDASEVPYDNSTSGLTATDVQAAIDELDNTLDNAGSGTNSLVFWSRSGTTVTTIASGDDVSITGDVLVSGTVDGRDVAADGTKLDGIESGATADQTAAEIKTAYESNNNTNAFTDAEQTKLSGIETGATADQTGAEIKTAYEGEADTNAFTDAEKTKLAGIAAGAEVNVDTDLSYTASTRVLASSTGTDATLPEVVAGGDSGLMTGSDKSKLDGIETGATADQDASEVTYDPSTSGMTATDLQDAIDELDNRLDNSTSTGTSGPVFWSRSGTTVSPINSGDDVSVNGDISVTGTVDGRDVSVDGAKLDGIEANADVTDATNVAAAGAVMESDTTTASMSFVIDEDTMVSNSSTKVPTQQSVKAYVDAEVAGVVDAAPGTLDTLNELAAALGDDPNFATTVTNSIAAKLPLAGGTMTGNIVMSGSQTVDGRDLSVDGSKLDGIESGATADQTAAEIKTAYESNNNTNAFTDAEKTKLSGIAAGAEVNVQSDWNATSGDALILNKPTIPTNNNQLTNGAGYITSSGSITGNAATATRLQTSRNINGVGFNGTANITVEPYVEQDLNSNASRYLTFVDSSTAGYQRQNVDTGLTYNPFSNTLSTVNFSGNLTGTATNAGLLNNQLGSYYLNYNNFTNTPTIPTNNNQLTNGAGYVTSSGNTVIGTDSDINFSGATVLATASLTDGVWTSFTSRTLTLANLGYTGATNANYITNNNQLTNGAGYVTSSGSVSYATDAGYATNAGNADTVDSLHASSFLRSDAADTSTQRIVFQANETNNWDTIATGSGNLGCLEVKNNGSGTDAFVAFHVGGDYACYFGLDGGTNKLSVGGWSMGANSYEIYHSGNKPSLAALGYTGATNANYITNNNQLTNGAGYITNSGGTVSATANTIVKRDGSADINCRLLRPNYQNQTSISGAIAFRVNNGSDNYLRFCSNGAAIRSFIGAGTSSFSGSYNDLTNKPTIPTNNNQLTNGAGYITNANGGNAATLDSIDSSQFLRSDVADQKTSGTLRFNNNVKCSFGNGDHAQFYHNGYGDFYLDLDNEVSVFNIRYNQNARFMFWPYSGDMEIGGQYYSFSDINLKENIEVIPNALDKVSEIRGVTYNRNDLEDDTRHAGVIAQEVEQVLPEAVRTDRNGIKSVTYGNMVPLLVEAIKEQQATIETLTQRIEVLEGGN